MLFVFASVYFVRYGKVLVLIFCVRKSRLKSPTIPKYAVTKVVSSRTLTMVSWHLQRCRLVLGEPITAPSFSCCLAGNRTLAHRVKLTH